MVHEMKTKWIFQQEPIITSRLLRPQRMSYSYAANTQEETIGHLERIKRCH